MDGGSMGKVTYTRAKFPSQCLQELGLGLGQVFAFWVQVENMLPL